MRIKQNADCAIAINRFDTGEAINFDFLSEMDIDGSTANYLLNMRTFDENGVLLSDFVEVK